MYPLHLMRPRGVTRAMLLSFLSKPLILAAKGAIVVTIVLMWEILVDGASSYVPIHDPWFLVFVCWWLFSCITHGMPEPTIDRSDNYLWAYRTMHLMAASGTSYFRHKIEFPEAQKRI